jgi:hypothetical protein
VGRKKGKYLPRGQGSLDKQILAPFSHSHDEASSNLFCLLLLFLKKNSINKYLSLPSTRRKSTFFFCWFLYLFSKCPANEIQINEVEKKH